MTKKTTEQDPRIATYDARNHPAQLVRRVHQRGAQLFTQATLTPNLSVTQFVALVTLMREGPMAQSRLGRMTSMDPSTTTVVIRKLEKDGMIVKRRAPEDQRTSVIELTEAGHLCAATHVPISLKAGDDLLAPLTEIERLMFLELLRKLLSTDEPQ